MALSLLMICCCLLSLLEANDSDASGDPSKALESIENAIGEFSQLVPSEGSSGCDTGVIEYPLSNRSELLALADECRGVILLQLGHRRQAVKSLSEAVAFDSTNPDILVNYGVALQLSNQLQAAMRQYRMAIKLSHRHKLANYHRGLLYLMNAQIHQAVDTLNNAISSDKTEYAVATTDSRCQRLKQRTSDVRKTDPAIYLARATAHYLLARRSQDDSLCYAAAREDIAIAEQRLSAYQQFTSWCHFHFTKGQVLMKVGDLVDADLEFTKGSRV